MNSGHWRTGPRADSVASASGGLRQALAIVRASVAGGLPIPEGLGHEALTHASLLLHATTRLAVATGIASIWARDPFAAYAGSRLLRAGHDDRFVLGLGVSRRLLVDACRSQAYERPLDAMDSYLTQLEALDASTGSSGPRAIAALGPRMLELADSHGVGVLTHLTTVEYTVDARRRLARSHLSVEVPVVVGGPEQSRTSGRRHLSTYLNLENYLANFRRLDFADDDFADNGSDRLIDSVVAHGTIDDVRARVHERLAAGADHVAVQPLDELTLANLLDFGASVFP